MDNYEIIQRLENAKDLETEPQRLMDFVEMGRNIFLVDNDYEEGRRVCLKGRDLALDLARTTKEAVWYKVYLRALLHLARHFRDFDSYLIYVEHNRDPQDQFYLPRRECFRKIGIMQAFQDMLDDKLDLLTISLAPGVGKAEPLYSKVLTPNGFVRMGSIKIGDIITAANGKDAKVLGVFPQGKKPIYEFALANGAKVRSSDEHLWQISREGMDEYGRSYAEDLLVTTDYIVKNYENELLSIPVYNPEKKGLDGYYALEEVTYIGKEECQCIYIGDPSHLYVTDDYVITHNTTLEGFFITYVMGLNPDQCNLFSSYSGSITEMFHRSAYNILTNKEYAWSDVFPGIKIEAKSDKEEFINLNKYKPFKSLQCRSINSSTTGVTRAEGYLMCDDLVSGIEEALNPERLETLYMKYVSDLKSRRKLGCKEIHIATRWSVHDVIGHLIAKTEDESRARFIAVDCFDENGESNFDFKYGKGFDTAYFRQMEEAMDDVTFRCMYRSDPIEREGLLYHDDELLYYLGGLPAEEDGKTKEPDAVLAVCDTKDTGTDFNCLLVVYQYGERFYLEDLVYDNGSPYVLDELNANCLVKNKVQMAQFESNKEGSRTGDQVSKIIKDKGGHCQILKKYTTQNKETKIIVNSDWVKKHVYFKDKTELEPKGMYRKFLTDMCRYVTLGKNKHDDSVDALAMLALFVQNLAGSVAEVYDRRELGI